jgi:hypothetical protein
MNFVSGLAMVNNGVREIVPFIRYISQFIDFEYNTIKSQDKGAGVVCAATWYVMCMYLQRFDLPMICLGSCQLLWFPVLGILTQRQLILLSLL